MKLKSSQCGVLITGPHSLSSNSYHNPVQKITYVLRYNLHINTELQEKYTTIAKDYSKTIALLNTAYVRFYLKHIPSNTIELLDVGCGSGDMLLALSRKLKGISFYGIDPIQTFVDLAKEKLPDSTILKASVEKLPFEDCSFGFILSHVVFQHVDRQKALLEIKRVLKPHGRIVLTEVLVKHDTGSVSDRLTYFIAQMLNNVALLLKHGPITYSEMHQYTKSADWQGLTAIHRARRFTYSELVSFYNQHLPHCKIIRLSPQLVSVVWDNV